ncbi:MAG: stage III sporulation protein AA, partial [Peptostreptococcales bacterium]
MPKKFMKDKIDYIFNRFPGDIKAALLRIDERIKSNIEEIRIHAEGSLLIYTSNKEYSLNMQNRIVEGVHNCKVISKETLTGIFNALLNYSAYAYEDEVANGYITIMGGHRVGVCGKVVMENGNIKTLKDISSLNIRRSKEIIGISERYMKYILKDDMSFYNTLIVSPPKCGKTTLLRDIARNLSNRNFKIGMVDERSEIAGMFEGISQNEIGPRTHVLDGCP